MLLQNFSVTHSTFCKSVSLEVVSLFSGHFIDYIDDGSLEILSTVIFSAYNIIMSLFNYDSFTLGIMMPVLNGKNN